MFFDEDEKGNRYIASKDLRDKTFPECGDRCWSLHNLGCCECESMCPHKFDENGDSIKVLNNVD